MVHRGRDSASRMLLAAAARLAARSVAVLHPSAGSVLAPTLVLLVRIAWAGGALAHLPSLRTFRRPRCLISSPSTTSLRLVC